MTSSSTTPPFSHGQIHVWQQALDVGRDCLDRLNATLSSDERDRAGRFHDAAISATWIAARGLLRSIIARYVQAPPHALVFTYNRFGKPSLKTSGRPQLCFNLAHSGSRMLLAIARDQEVGVDLEQLRPERVDRRLVKRFLTADDLRCFDQLPSEAQAAWFFRRWTRMEALLKARGSGLARVADWIGHDDSPRLKKILAGCPDAVSWRLRELNLDGDYVGALAAAGPAWSVTMYCADA